MNLPVIIHDLEFYQVDPEHGFLPKEDPIERLPFEYEVWERLAAQLPALLITGQIRSSLENLTRLNLSALENESQLRRAFLLLSIFGSAYVWGGEKPATIIPHTIALPWWELAEKLGLSPIICHHCMVLDNWRRLDKNKPIELDNICALQLFLGGLDEQWFFTTHVAIEAKGASAIVSIVEAQKSVSLGKVEGVVAQLKRIPLALAQMYAVLLQIPEKCDPYIFYHRVRPFTASWPESGVIYEGVSDIPKKLVGGSGAQSPLIQSLDAGLGISHQDNKHRSFFQRMRSYMLPAHSKFIEVLEVGPSLREFVLEHKDNYPTLLDFYNESVKALEEFRRRHMQIAASYIARHAPQHTKGTSGTDFPRFLQKVRQQTKAHSIG